ncbi:hypothetical protein Vadar_020668 [Vaccinium darrowii]|uniref:Uncharacterized protein n=1 Tax=Vaccinium darrowii TaxID=229202 RepID=A0ACB7Y7X3_9ERIC|nr:hypothetical protein Vadar_020668 [Vaccinium darrowii]
MTLTQQLHSPYKKPLAQKWEPIFVNSNNPVGIKATETGRINERWMEYQGVKNWEGLLDPLDDNLRREIIRYGNFVEAAYRAFDFDPDSPSYATCKHPKSSLLDRAGFAETGYRVTKNLRATSGIQLPRWIKKNTPKNNWVGTPSSWVGYVAVCNDKEEISRLGRRDIVVALRGTATCLEWLENLRATQTKLSNSGSVLDPDGTEAMVESGFLSLYTSASKTNPSLQYLVREEIQRLLQRYGDEPLSITITGHSLGAALATLMAYDIKTTFNRAPLVTVISFGGPRVGNRSFRHGLEKQGTKVLRIVNQDDLITKLPGFVMDNNDDDGEEGNGYVQMVKLSGWIQKRVEEAQWAYADVGHELRLSSRDSPYLDGSNVATCHDLKTYLHLVNGFVSSTCPFRATAREIIKKKKLNNNEGSPLHQQIRDFYTNIWWRRSLEEHGTNYTDSKSMSTINV